MHSLVECCARSCEGSGNGYRAVQHFGRCLPFCAESGYLEHDILDRLSSYFLFVHKHIYIYMYAWRQLKTFSIVASVWLW